MPGSKPKPAGYVRYPSDYLADTNRRMMSWAAQGVYNALLDHLWENRLRPLPLDFDKLSRLLGNITPGRLAKMWPELAPSFHVYRRGNKELFTHFKLKRSWKRAEQETILKRKAGKKGAEKRWSGRGLDSNRDSRANSSRARGSDPIRSDPSYSSSSSTPPPKGNGQVPDGALQVIRDRWNEAGNLIRATRLTGLMELRLSARFEDGFSIRDLLAIVTRYSELEKVGRAPGWGRWTLSSFLSKIAGDQEYGARMLDPEYEGIPPKRERERIALQRERKGRK